MLCIFKISGAVLQKTAVNFILKTGVAVLGRQNRPQKTRAISARPRSQLYVSVMVSETCT